MGIAHAKKIKSGEYRNDENLMKFLNGLRKRIFLMLGAREKAA